MITAIVGKPGSGKTLYLVALAREYLRKGIDVYCNVPINEKYFNIKKKNKGTLYYWDNIQEIKYAKKGKVLADELGAYFDSRGWQTFPRDIRVKFQQYRKDGLDILYTVQSYGRADAIIRQVTNYVRQCKNLFGLIFYTLEYDADEYEAEKRKAGKFNIYIPNKSHLRAYDTNFGVNRDKNENHTFRKMSTLFSDT